MIDLLASSGMRVGELVTLNRVFVNKKVLQKGSKKVSTFNTQ